MDERRLRSWLRRSGREVRSFRVLAGDVSPRRYARLVMASGERAIAAVYPPELEDACRRFRQTTALLERAGIRVPCILVSDCSEGLMLLEDLGPETLYERRARPLEERLPLFDSALEIASAIGALPQAEVSALNPPLDADLLIRELGQTIELYLEPQGLLGSDDSSRRRSTDALERLCRALGEAPAVPCHRDYMARNLVPLAGGVAVLDHQDLRLGPPGYDLASLLNDSFFAPADLEERWLSRWLPTATERELYHRAAVQRTLKAVGTFAAFARRGFERHLALIAPTLERALRQLPLAPETAELGARLEPSWTRHLAAGGG